MRRIRYVILVAGLVVMPVTTFADELYFEFRPDYAQSLLVASAPQPVEQVFLALNDHISGFDVWLSNAGIGGPATFQFFNPSGTSLSTTTITVPSIQDDTPQRTKVTLPTQVATDASGAYYFRISTPVPTMRLHYASQNAILAHNAAPQALYTGGIARTGGEERTYAFLFSLYEGTEGTVPVITDMTASVLSVQQVQIAFHASEPVDVTIAYAAVGQGQQAVVYSGQYTSCPDGLTKCSVVLPITHPGADHTFTLTVRDVWGNTATTTGTFTAAGIELSPTPDTATTPAPTATPVPTPDVIAPSISNIRVIDVSHESAAIAWTTDEAANSLVVVQFGIDRITAGGNSDSTLELEHLLTIGNLGPLTPYTARVQSADASGNDTSVDFEFSTTAVPTPNPGATPTPSVDPTPTPTVSVGPSGSDGESEASWTPPAGGAPNGFRVDVIGANGELIRTIYTFDTSADLGAIPDGARVVVYADRGNDVFEKVAAPAVARSQKPFLERLVTMLPYIIGGLGGILIIGGLTYQLLSRRKESKQAPEPPSSSPFTASR